MTPFAKVQIIHFENHFKFVKKIFAKPITSIFKTIDINKLQ